MIAELSAPITENINIVMSESEESVEFERRRKGSRLSSEEAVSTAQLPWIFVRSMKSGSMSVESASSSINKSGRSCSIELAPPLISMIIIEFELYDPNEDPESSRRRSGRRELIWFFCDSEPERDKKLRRKISSKAKANVKKREKIFIFLSFDEDIGTCGTL